MAELPRFDQILGLDFGSQGMAGVPGIDRDRRFAEKMSAADAKLQAQRMEHFAREKAQRLAELDAMQQRAKMLSHFHRMRELDRIGRENPPQQMPNLQPEIRSVKPQGGNPFGEWRKTLERGWHLTPQQQDAYNQMQRDMDLFFHHDRDSGRRRMNEGRQPLEQGTPEHQEYLERMPPVPRILPQDQFGMFQQQQQQQQNPFLLG